jgi:5-methyltetrahydropteroyltriglutamate--homocysteine methyltransferase
MLPTTAVGSYPKPPELLKARTRFARGDLSPEALREREERATVDWIRFQEALDMDLLVDGEQYRGDMVTYFAEHFDGIEVSGLVRSYGNRYYRKPIVVGEVVRRERVTVDWWRFAQSLTDRPVKGMLTGPYTMMDWSFDEYYPSREDCAVAFARLVRDEVRDLVRAGATVIQIDEPAISTRPEELDLAIRTMAVVTKGLEGVKTISHMCYGNFDRVYPRLLDLPVDQLDLEMSNSGFDLLDLFRRHPFTKEIGFGVIDVHTPVLETVDEVADRIRKALAYFPPDRLYVDPDCGLKTRTVEEAKGKLRAMAAGAAKVRQELAVRGA